MVTLWHLELLPGLVTLLLTPFGAIEYSRHRQHGHNDLRKEEEKEGEYVCVREGGRE